MSNEAFDMNSNSTHTTPPADNQSYIQNIVNRAKEILLTPELAWSKIKAEDSSLSKIYSNYFIVLAAITPIATWINICVIGISLPLIGRVRAPFFSGLIDAALQYAGSLAMLYIGSLVLEKLAPTFNAKTNQLNAAKLMAYSATPVMLAGAFMILPLLGTLAMIAGAVYAIYLFWTGLDHFVEVSTDKKPVYVAASIVTTALCGGLLFYIVSLISPLGYRNFSAPQVNYDELEQNLKDFQKMLPKP